MRAAEVCRTVCVTVLAALLFGCRSTSVAPAVDLERLFDDLHARGLFDGAVVVSGPAGLIFEKGYGYANVERGVPFTADTPTDGASLAKTFTAALLLDMERDGLLRLDDPARKYLPELPYPDITLQHLLTHTSGIPVLDYDYFDAYVPKDQVRTTEVLLRALAARRPQLASTPGTFFEYSSFGYDLAALAAARAGGRPYIELLNERFFRPLGMTSPFVRPGRFSDFPGVRTLAYRRSDTKLEVNDVFDLEAFHGGSNVYISARDLDRWNRAFMRGRLAGGAVDRRDFARIGGGTSGLTPANWYRSTDGQAFWYSGHLQGFHNEVFRDLRRGWSVIYASNNTIEPWLQKGLVRAVMAVLAGETHEPLVAPAVDVIAREERLSLAGKWVLPSGDPFVIESSGGRILAVTKGVHYRIVQITPKAFYIPGLDFILGFAKAADGMASKIYVSSNVAEEWGSRARTERKDGNAHTDPSTTLPGKSLDLCGF